MTTTALIILLVVAAVAVWTVVTGGGLPAPYRVRSCQGDGWKRAFPQATKKEIRDFLLLFTDAFAFKSAQRLQFHPNDRIVDIYRALYPDRWTPDALELETLARDFERAYDLSLEGLWNDALTLGDLFAATGPHRSL